MLVEAPDSGERRFAQLNVDAIQQITALLPTASLLALTAVSQELGRTFCPAVARLAVSKVPEPFSPLSPSHTSLSHPLTYPTVLTSLSNTGLSAHGLSAAGS